MPFIHTVDELKAAIDMAIAAKTLEIEAIFQREFPGAFLCDADSEYAWMNGEDFFSNKLDKDDPERLLSKGLSLKLPPDSETLIVIEFGWSGEQEENICLRYVMFNCFINSRIFSDDLNPLLISSGAGRGDWDGVNLEPPQQKEAYERVADQLFQLLSGTTFQ